MDCVLCHSKSNLFYTGKNEVYFKCTNCNLIFLNPQNLPSSNQEYKRYLQHNNNVEDKGYQNFVKPIVEYVFNTFDECEKGLDFGCGPAPVITKLLREKQYNITTFDPYFYNHSNALKTTYNYIVCCEVVEHFHNPNIEFKKLHSLLKQNGKLILKTQLFSSKISFEKWWYKNDLTHVVFYQKETFKWIKNHFNFKQLLIKDSLILLSK